MADDGWEAHTPGLVLLGLLALLLMCTWLYHLLFSPKVHRVRAAPHIHLLDMRPAVSEPIVPQEQWKKLPGWIKMNRQRGSKYPHLHEDPLFLGKGDPCLIPYLPEGGSSTPAAVGAIVIVPGGNYEFLAPNEGEPIAKWLVQNLGVPACILRYRLLPDFCLDQAAADLTAGLREARRLAAGGPVAVVGFSAGAHLAVSVTAGTGAVGEGALAGGEERTRPDAQVLVYPSIDARDWLSRRKSGFYRTDEQSPEVLNLVRDLERLLPGPAFVPPPPTFVASSTHDAVASPEQNSDLYVKAARDAGVPVEYLRKNFGHHGFSTEEGWRRPCLKWLRKQGIGGRPTASSKRD